MSQQPTTKTVSPEMVKRAGELLRESHLQVKALEKRAQDTELEKRAQRLAFREVELGIAEPYKTHEEFTAKVAGLLKEDLGVVEKALERGYPATGRSGALSDTGGQATTRNPLEHFVLTGELLTND